MPVISASAPPGLNGLHYSLPNPFVCGHCESGWRLPGAWGSCGCRFVYAASPLAPGTAPSCARTHRLRQCKSMRMELHPTLHGIVVTMNIP